MKDSSDFKTLPLLPEKRGRGRPPSSNPVSPADRKRALWERDLQRVAVGDWSSVTDSSLLRMMSTPPHVESAWREFGRRRGFVF